MKLNQMPYETRRKVRALADRVPKDRREAFIQDVGNGLQDMIESHPQVLIWTLSGWILGEFIDNIVGIPLPFTSKVLRPTLGHMSTVMAVLGFLQGHKQDQRLRSERYWAEEESVRKTAEQEMREMMMRILEMHLQPQAHAVAANTGMGTDHA